ncbi:MAG: hypothetical protein KJ626_01020 [Verrucomicrobia bacterium]|nr:hypothetical protein [Verrucomicrobiota bacterium]
MAMTLRLRPKLEFTLTGTVAQVVVRLRDTSSDYIITVVDNYVIIALPAARRHYWSPQLQVSLDDEGEHVHVHGLVTPMPTVWMLFAGIYTAIVTLGFFATMFGLAQHHVGQKPMGLWAVPISLFLIGVVYIAARIGQRIGREQTEELTAFLRDVGSGVQGD